MQTQNQTILITGGATGIGLSLAKRFLDRKNTVVVCGRRVEELDRARQQLPKLVTRQCDVTRDDERASLVRWLEESYSGASILVNNAGVQFPHSFLADDVRTPSVELEVAINLVAPILLTAALLPLLLRQEEPRIVNVTSALGFCPIAHLPVYCATKAAMHSFTLSLRHQLRTTGARVVEIAPPIVRTGLAGAGSDRQGGDQPVLTPDEFTEQVMQQWDEDKDEILVGLAVGMRQQGEALFLRINH